MELESVETITVRRHEELMYEVRIRHTDEATFGRRPLGRMKTV